MAEPLKVAADYRIPFIYNAAQEIIWSNVSIPFDSDGITDEQRSSWGFPTALSSYPATDFYLSSTSELPEIKVMIPPSVVIHFDNIHEYNIPSLSIIHNDSGDYAMIGYSNDNKIAILIPFDTDESSEGMVADSIDILVSDSLLEEIGYTSGDNITLQLNGLTGQIYYYHFGESSTPRIITPPTIPIPGKKIIGWYTDPEYTTLFNFETTPVDPTSRTVYYGKTTDMNPSYGITHLQINYNDYLYHQLDGRYIEHKGYSIHESGTKTEIIPNLQIYDELSQEQATQWGLTDFSSYPIYLMGTTDNFDKVIKENVDFSININNINYNITCTPINIDTTTVPPFINVAYSEDNKVAVIFAYSENRNMSAFYICTNYDMENITLFTVSISYHYDEDTIVPFDRKFIPAATRNEIGGIKVGNNLSIDSDGTLNASSGEVEIDYSTIFKGFQNQLQAIGKKGTGTNAEIFNYWQDSSGTSYNNNVAAGDYSHAEGYRTAAIGNSSHVEGQGYVYNIHISGSGTTYSYDSDSFTPTSGDLIERRSYNTYTRILTVDNQNHTFTTLNPISDTEISNWSAFCFTLYTYGFGSHAEGYGTKAIGDYSHAEGYETIASGWNSHAGGDNTIAGYNYQTVVGKYNNNKSDTLFEVGNGNQDSRSNALEVHSNGRVTIGAQPIADMDVATKKYVDENGGSYTLPVATSSTLGGVKVGNSLTISNGVLNYTLPAATSSNLGGVMIEYDSETQTLYMTTE